MPDRLGDRESLSKLLHRKPVVPFNRRPGPAPTCRYSPTVLRKPIRLFQAHSSLSFRRFAHQEVRQVRHLGFAASAFFGVRQPCRQVLKVVTYTHLEKSHDADYTGCH